jgi:protein phosphatase 1L
MNKVVWLFFVLISAINFDLYAVRVYSHSEKGRRGYQEDRLSIFPKESDWPEAGKFYAGVYDGHGGYFVSKYLKKELINRIIACEICLDMSDDVIASIIKSEFVALNNEILDQTIMTSFLDPGSTALLAVLLNNQKLIIANVGDCRAVLAKTNDIWYTKDHKPNDCEEKSRIESLGGTVFNGRVSAILAVSRAFGDKQLSKWVTSDPDVSVMNVDSSFDFLILASDGLWDVFSSEEAVQFVRDNGGPSDQVCNQIVLRALEKRSLDNISVLIIDFKNI